MLSYLIVSHVISSHPASDLIHPHLKSYTISSHPISTYAILSDLISCDLNQPKLKLI